ncbi:hypothetical protein [Viscerimonas tarda]
MKKLLITLLFAAIAVQSHSQCDLPYKPFEFFKNDATLMNDTITYLEYNFEARRDCYIGKTIADVIQDLELPIKAFQHTSVGSRIGSLELCLSDGLNYADINAASPMVYQGISISLEDTVFFSSVKKLIDEYPLSKWAPEHYEFFKNVRIKWIMNNSMKKRTLEVRWAKASKNPNERVKPYSGSMYWSYKQEDGRKALKNLLPDKTVNSKLRSAANTKLSEKDVRNLNTVPIEIFTLSRHAAKRLASSPDSSADYIRRSLSPKAKETLVYAANNQSFVAAINSVYRKEKGWEIKEYESIDPNVSKTLSEIYFEKQLPVYMVYVGIDYSASSAVSDDYVPIIDRKYLIYIDNGEYKVIKPDGTTDLLINELIEYKNSLGE